jgi:hypothetical protein
LLVAATDLNVSLTAERKSTNASEGGTTLGAKNLYELIANAPGETRSAGRSIRGDAHINVMHVIEKLWTGGECLFRRGQRPLRQWIDVQKDRLYTGRVDEVIAVRIRRWR